MEGVACDSKYATHPLFFHVQLGIRQFVPIHEKFRGVLGDVPRVGIFDHASDLYDRHDRKKKTVGVKVCVYEREEMIVLCEGWQYLHGHEHVALSGTTSMADGGTESTEGSPHSLCPWVGECRCQSIYHGHFVEGSGCH